MAEGRLDTAVQQQKLNWSMFMLKHNKNINQNMTYVLILPRDNTVYKL